MYVEVFNGGGNEVVVAGNEGNEDAHGGNERASKSDEGDSGSEFGEERDVIEVHHRGHVVQL